MTKAQLQQRLDEALETIDSLNNELEYEIVCYDEFVKAQKAEFEKIDGLLQDLFIDAEYLGTNEKILSAIKTLKRQVSEMAETCD